MSYVNDPNDPNYVDPNTAPPVAEAVEPAGNPLRWLWWLLGLLVLAGLIWALVHACRDRECTVATNWNQAAVTNYLAEGWSEATTLSHLNALCATRGTGTLTATQVVNQFGAANLLGEGTEIVNWLNVPGNCVCN